MSTRSDKIAAVANAQVKECGGLMLAVLSGALVFLEKLQVGVVNKALRRSDTKADAPSRATASVHNTFYAARYMRHG
jgi:hypothetical protein